MPKFLKLTKVFKSKKYLKIFAFEIVKKRVLCGKKYILILSDNLWRKTKGMKFWTIQVYWRIITLPFTCNMFYCNELICYECDSNKYCKSCFFSRIINTRIYTKCNVTRNFNAFQSLYENSLLFERCLKICKISFKSTTVNPFEFFSLIESWATLNLNTHFYRWLPVSEIFWISQHFTLNVYIHIHPSLFTQMKN